MPRSERPNDRMSDLSDPIRLTHPIRPFDRPRPRGPAKNRQNQILATDYTLSMINVGRRVGGFCDGPRVRRRGRQGSRIVTPSQRTEEPSGGTVRGKSQSGDQTAAEDGTQQGGKRLGGNECLKISIPPAETRGFLKVLCTSSV